MRTQEQKNKSTEKPGKQAQTSQPEPEQKSSDKSSQDALKSDPKDVKK